MRYLILSILVCFGSPLAKESHSLFVCKDGAQRFLCTVYHLLVLVEGALFQSYPLDPWMVTGLGWVDLMVRNGHVFRTRVLHELESLDCLLVAHEVGERL